MPNDMIWRRFLMAGDGCCVHLIRVERGLTDDEPDSGICGNSRVRSGILS